jgi:Leucine-rich repeat (LRR) protein
MPFYLKQCFAFCSLFPKDYEFNSGELIAFWMAHGLLNKTPNSQNLELEDVGHMYIKELLSKSFFQDVTDFIWFYRFKMHDLVLDLALKVAEEECLTVDFRTQNVAETIRHLSFSFDCIQVPKYFDTLSSGVRTALFTTKQEVPALIEACILRLKYLRVLDLFRSSFEALPSSIDSLKHLKYLNLARNQRIKELPDSICKLYNLQTILLYGCWSLEQLPKDTRKMVSLRYMSITTTAYPCLFENGVGCLSSLRFFAIFDCCYLEVLFQGMDGSFTNLWTLVVRGCHKLTSLTLNIKHLTALETLVISDCEVLSLPEGEDSWDLKLNLRKVVIEGLPKLQVLPQWFKGSANTLQYMRISTCPNLEALPNWLPSKSFQTLEIVNCHKLEGREIDVLLERFGKEQERSTGAHIPTIQFITTFYEVVTGKIAFYNISISIVNTICLFKLYFSLLFCYNVFFLPVLYIYICSFQGMT